MGRISSIEEYINKIDKDIKNMARMATSKIADDLTKTAEFAVLKFYSSYNPVLYNNHFGVLNTYKRYYKNPHNTIYYGGVELLPSNGKYSATYLKNHPSVSPEYISELVYSGRHGATECFPKWVLSHVNNYPPVMSPSPIEIITKKKTDIMNHLSNYFR